MRNKSILQRFLHAPVYFYRWGLGGLLGRRFLLLTHIGRRIGLPHQTVLEVMDYRTEGKGEAPEIIVMSGFGRNSNWLRNVEATQEAEVTIGSRNFAAAYRILGEDEAVMVVRHYEQRNWVIAPVIRLVLSQLLGWKYRGSESDHRRLVGQLPLIAFWPRS